MATVFLEDCGGSRSATLDPRRSAQTVEEIRRVRGGWLNRLLRALFRPSQRAFATAPDMLIRIDDGGAQTVYELHGETVLRKRGETTGAPFYMGLKLLEWLYGSSAP